MPWIECVECWIPSRDQAHLAQQISVTYEGDDSREAARLAAQRYAEKVFQNVSLRIPTPTVES